MEVKFNVKLKGEDFNLKGIVRSQFILKFNVKIHFNNIL